MEHRINQVWWVRYGQRYVKWFLAFIAIICALGIVVVLVFYVVNTGGESAQSQTPPNLYQPISYFEGRLNHTISPDGIFNIPAGLPFKINCTLFVATERPRLISDEISLRSLTNQKTLQHKACVFQPLGMQKNVWWCSSLFEMSAVGKAATEELACCSSNWDSDECKNGYTFTLYFEVENDAISTTTRPATASTIPTTVTTDDNKTPAKLLPTKSPSPHKLQKKYLIVMISLVAVGSVAVCGSTRLYLRNRKENAICLSRLSCCRNPYQPQGDDDPTEDVMDSDEQEDDLF